MSEINYINESLEGISAVKLKIINHYQQKNPSLMAKDKTNK